MECILRELMISNLEAQVRTTMGVFLALKQVGYYMSQKHETCQEACL